MTVQGPAYDGGTVDLIEPSDSGYLLLGATVGGNPLSPTARRSARRVAQAIRPHLAQIAALSSVAEANAFVAQLVAPGMGRRLLDRRAVAAADFDVVVLVRTHHLDGLAALRADAAYQGLRSIVTAAARRDYEIAARNVRQIAEVDHSRRAVFLFNFFYADDPDILVPVWQHTAKWFVDKTHLPDSTVLAPLDGERTDHGIINHASWPHYRTFLPHLALRRSFRRFVLSVFELNGVAAQPILYRRVSG